MTSIAIAPGKLISRKAAQAKGLKVFFTGRPCKSGHICNRYVVSGSCVQCMKGGRKYARRLIAP